MKKVCFLLLLLSSTAAHSDEPIKPMSAMVGYSPSTIAHELMFGLGKDAVMVGLSPEAEKINPVCHRVRHGLSTCDNTRSVTDLDGVTTFYSADMMRTVGSIQLTGAVKP